MHRIMVSGLPAGCRLTAIFDVSKFKIHCPDANFPVGMPFWFGAGYEFDLPHEIELNFLFSDLPYTVRACRRYEHPCCSIAYL